MPGHLTKSCLHPAKAGGPLRRCELAWFNFPAERQNLYNLLAKRMAEGDPEIGPLGKARLLSLSPEANLPPPDVVRACDSFGCTRVGSAGQAKSKPRRSGTFPAPGWQTCVADKTSRSNGCDFSASVRRGGDPVAACPGDDGSHPQQLLSDLEACHRSHRLPNGCLDQPLV